MAKKEYLAATKQLPAKPSPSVPEQGTGSSTSNNKKKDRSSQTTSKPKQKVVRKDLVGAEFTQEWIDVSKTRQIIYGTIRKCFQESNGSLRYSVAYKKESRDLVNAIVSIMARIESYCLCKIR